MSSTRVAVSGCERSRAATSAHSTVVQSGGRRFNVQAGGAYRDIAAISAIPLRGQMKPTTPRGIAILKPQRTSLVAPTLIVSVSLA